MIDVHAVEREVIRLHRFFERWFSGEDGLSITEFSDVLDDAFTIVSPSGTETDRTAIIGAVEGAFGSSMVEIAIVDVHTMVADCSVICRYVEEHRIGSETTRRLSTAVFRFAEERDHRPIWITVHETWIGHEVGTDTPSRR